MKVSRKNLLKKWKTTQRWKISSESLTGTPSCRSNFWFQSGFSQKDDEEKFDQFWKVCRKKAFAITAIFCFICVVVVYIWVVKYQLKVFGTYLYAHWTYLWQCCIWNVSQYYNNLYFIETIINWNFIWNIVLNNGIYWDLRNKNFCLNTV